MSKEVRKGLRNIQEILRRAYVAEVGPIRFTIPPELKQFIGKDLLTKMWAAMLPHEGAGAIFMEQQNVIRQTILSIIQDEP